MQRSAKKNAREASGPGNGPFVSALFFNFRTGEFTMTIKRTPWLTAGIVVLAAAVSLAQTPKDERQPAGKADESAKAMMQCPMMASMKGMQTFADSPSVLLSQADELGLTAKQKKRLEKIQQKARQKAQDVLTAEQQKKLEDYPKGRISMMDLAMMRMKRMMGQKKQQGMMCPMCMKMMQQQRKPKQKQENRKGK